MIDISRRSFIKGLIASAISLGIDPYAGIVVANDLYQNQRLGVSFHKPNGWEFDSVADFAALRERQILINEDQEVHPLKDPESLPTVIIADIKHQQGDFAPAIMLWDEILNHPNPSNLSSEIHQHRRMIRNFSHSYKDVQVISEPEQLIVKGAKGTQATWRYRHEVEDGQAYALKIRSLLFFRYPRVHTYYLIDLYDVNYVAPKIFNDFAQTIKYDQA